MVERITNINTYVLNSKTHFNRAKNARTNIKTYYVAIRISVAKRTERNTRYKFAVSIIQKQFHKVVLMIASKTYVKSLTFSLQCTTGNETLKYTVDGKIGLWLRFSFCQCNIVMEIPIEYPWTKIAPAPDCLLFVWTVLVAVPQTDSKLRKGDNGVGCGYPPTTRGLQYARVHLYVCKSFETLII